MYAASLPRDQLVRESREPYIRTHLPDCLDCESIIARGNPYSRRLIRMPPCLNSSQFKPSICPRDFQGISSSRPRERFQLTRWTSSKILCFGEERDRLQHRHFERRVNRRTNINERGSAPSPSPVPSMYDEHGRHGGRIAEMEARSGARIFEAVHLSLNPSSPL